MTDAASSITVLFTVRGAFKIVGLPNTFGPAYAEILLDQ